MTNLKQHHFELRDAANGYHTAHPSEKAKHEADIDTALEKFSFIELARLLISSRKAAQHYLEHVAE